MRFQLASLIKPLSIQAWELKQSITILLPRQMVVPEPSKDFIVSVILTTDLSNSPPAKSQCNNQNTNITLTSSVVGTTFTWTCTPVRRILPAGQTISSDHPFKPVTGELRNCDRDCYLSYSAFCVRMYRYHEGLYRDCFPNTSSNNAPLTKSLCNNSNTNIPLSSNVAGTLFTWTCTPSSANITGWANNTVRCRFG